VTIELDAVKATSSLTRAHAQDWVRKADPHAHAAVLAVGGCAVLGRHADRERTYRGAFRRVYENQVMGGQHGQA
jgi:hypothetical protein